MTEKSIYSDIRGDYQFSQSGDNKNEFVFYRLDGAVINYTAVRDILDSFIHARLVKKYGMDSSISNFPIHHEEILSKDKKSILVKFIDSNTNAKKSSFKNKIKKFLHL